MSSFGVVAVAWLALVGGALLARAWHARKRHAPSCHVTLAASAGAFLMALGLALAVGAYRIAPALVPIAMVAVPACLHLVRPSLPGAWWLRLALALLAFSLLQVTLGDWHVRQSVPDTPERIDGKNFIHTPQSDALLSTWLTAGVTLLAGCAAGLLGLLFKLLQPASPSVDRTPQRLERSNDD